MAPDGVREQGRQPAHTPGVDATALIVTYNSAADVGTLLEMLPAAAGSRRLRVIVLDNASVDHTESVVATFPEVEFVKVGWNAGYSGAINVGRRLIDSGSRATVILNPDVVPAPGSIQALLEALERPGVGAAVPRYAEPDGHAFPSLRREPSVGRALFDGLLGAHWPGRPAPLSEIVWDPEVYRRPGPAAWATGAVLAIAGTADRAVGAWDDARFFLYCEETDIARRLRAAGYVVWYEPRAEVAHRGGGSGTGDALVALNAVNRIRYYRKYHGRIATAAFRAAVMLGEVMRVRRSANRSALRALVRPGTWGSLPGGIRGIAPATTHHEE